MITLQWAIPQTSVADCLTKQGRIYELFINSVTHLKTMSVVAEPTDASVSTEAPKPVETSNPSTTTASPTAEPTEVQEARNDDPTTEEEKDDVAITINGTTIVLLPEDTLVSMSHWVDDVNEYWDLKEMDKADDSTKKSARERLTGSLIVMGVGVKNKTVKITHGMAEWFVSTWKGQAEKGESREEPAQETVEKKEMSQSKSESLKIKFNDFLESLKFAIPDKDETAASVVNLGAFNDDDSAMMANADIEVMLAESTETHEC